MTFPTSRRPLADLLTEMSDGISGLIPIADKPSYGDIGLYPTSLSCKLPVETSFTFFDGKLQLLIGVPQRQERTYFDRPVNKLTFHIEAKAC
jgi:hypothetical protein